MMAILEHIARLYPCVAGEDFRNYAVNDVLQGDELKVVLLLESPHRDELKDTNRERLPAVGATGRSVTKLLDAFVHQMPRMPSQTDPIGRLCGRPRGRFAWLGLMNACQIPLQRKAYRYDPDLRRRYPRLLADLDEFKKTLDRGEDADVMEDKPGEAIKAAFQERLEPIQHRRLLLVPCGRIARALCRATGIPVDPRLPRVPHPGARDAWGHAPALVKMVDVIRAEIG